MPRAAQSDDAPKRSPRKRAITTRTTAERVPRRTAPRKRAAAKTTNSDTLEQVETRVDERIEARRAPTPVAATRARARAKQFQLFVSAVIIIVGIGASAAVGVTDEGQIDVAQTIEDRNERIRSGHANEQEQGGIIVPVQNTNERLPDGGLRGRGIGTASTPVVPDPLASTTASTTDGTASSTDATASSTDTTAAENVADNTTEETVLAEDATPAETETAPVETSAAIDDAGR